MGLDRNSRADFSPTFHAICPLCNFELLHKDADNQSYKYIIKETGQPDILTEEHTEKGDRIKQSDHDTAECNHVNCSFTDKLSEFVKAYL